VFKLTDDLIAELRSVDTPTVCNALEILVPERRGSGFTTRPLVCTRPELGPTVGVARTATIRATPASHSPADQAAAHDEPGYGSFWGEVNSNIHKGLGCHAVITDGSVRDLPDIADGFQMLADRVGPSHAFVHVVDHSRPVTVAGMKVSDGDLIHADQHGAVVIPQDVCGEIKHAADLVGRRERVIITAAQQPGFDVEELRRAQRRAAEI
jgi:hypothetical protein